MGLHLDQRTSLDLQPQHERSQLTDLSTARTRDFSVVAFLAGVDNRDGSRVGLAARKSRVESSERFFLTVSISSELGDRRIVQVPAGSIEYRDRGTGPAIVFVH